MKRENAIKKSLLLSLTKPYQLFIAALGCVLGLGILVLGIQLYFDLNHLIKKQKDLMSGEFLVISKKIGLLNTFSGRPSYFSEEEIKELEKVKGIKSVGVFQVGNFKTSLQIEAPGNSAEVLKTELFLEAIPSEYLDVKEHWSWTEGDQTIPLVIPQDYLQLYNLGFAGSQGLPLIPENLLKSVRFQLLLRGNNKNLLFKGRIAGFSNRIQSILVPQEFLTWANKTLSSGSSNNPARIVAWAKDPAAPEIENFLQVKDWDWNKDKLKSGKLQSLLFSLILVIAFFGVTVVLLALTGLIQYLQLLAFRSAYEVNTLFLIGYHKKELRRPYIQFAIKILVSSCVLALILLIAARHFWASWLLDRGFDISEVSIFTVIIGSILLTFTMYWIHYISIKNQIETLTGKH